MAAKDEAAVEAAVEAALARRRAYMNAYMRARCAKWRAAGLCAKCGKPRTAKGRSPKQCAACLTRRARQFEKDSARKRTEDGRIFRGRSSPAPMVKRVKVMVERRLIPAIDELQRQSRAESPGGVRISLSQTVRAAICDNFGGDPPARVPDQEFMGLMCPGVSLNFCLDARTWAVVRYHADRSFGGETSRTIRAMLWAASRAKASAGGVANPFYKVTHGRVKY